MNAREPAAGMGSIGWLVLVVVTMAGIAMLPLLAHAECNLDLARIPVFRWTGGGSGYDPFDANSYYEHGEITVQNRARGACAYFLSFSQGGAPTYDRRLVAASDELRYQLYDSVSARNTLKDIPTATAQEVLSGSFDNDSRPGSRTKHSYVVHVFPSQTRGPGAYQDTVVVTLFAGTLESRTLVAQEPLRLTADVASVLQLAVVDRSAPFDAAATSYVLDFGDLTPGAQGATDLLVRANTRYRVLMSSTSDGAMGSNTPGVTTRVPYTLRLDGTLVQLQRRPVSVTPPTPPTSTDPNRMRVDLTIGSTDDALPGEYADTITITIEAQ